MFVELSVVMLLAQVLWPYTKD